MDVPALRVADEHRVRRLLPDAVERPVQGLEARPAQRLEEAQVGLVGTHQVRRGLDDGAVEGRDVVHGHEAGVRVEPHAEQAAVAPGRGVQLVDESTHVSLRP